MEDSRFARCLQGGGVFVGGGTVAISSCTISGNTASQVRAHAQNFPSPNGKIADALASTHACTTAARALVNCSRYVPQRPEISHRPDGNLLTRLPQLSLLHNCGRRFGQLQPVRGAET